MDTDVPESMMAMTVADGTLAASMGIKIVSATGTEVVATMPVAGNIQPFGLLHGGASCVLAETVGSLAAALHAGAGRTVVGIEISATHHRGARDGEVTAVATLAHGGRTLATYDIVITDPDGHRICTSRLTCLIRDRVPGGGAGTNRKLPAPGDPSVRGRLALPTSRRVDNVEPAGPGGPSRQRVGRGRQARHQRSPRFLP